MILTIEIEEKDMDSLMRHMEVRKLLWDIYYCAPSIVEKAALKICEAYQVEKEKSLLKKAMEHDPR